MARQAGVEGGYEVTGTEVGMAKIKSTPGKHWTEGPLPRDWEKNLLNSKKRAKLEAEGQQRLIPEIGDPMPSVSKKRTKAERKLNG